MKVEQLLITGSVEIPVDCDVAEELAILAELAEWHDESAKINWMLD